MNDPKPLEEKKELEFQSYEPQCKCYECRTGEDICDACEDFGHQIDEFQP